jgi:hypothetical protein
MSSPYTCDACHDRSYHPRRKLLQSIPIHAKSPPVPTMFDIHEAFSYVSGTGDPVYAWEGAGRNAQQFVQANAPDNWHWDSFDEQSLLLDCPSETYLQTSNSTSNGFYGQRVPESSQLLYRPAASAHHNTIESQPGFEMYSASSYRPSSRSKLPTVLNHLKTATSALSSPII